MTDGLTELLFRVETKIGQDARDEVFDGVAATEDLCARQGATGEVGFERLNETAFVLGVEIVLDGGGAGKTLDVAAACLFELLEIKDGTKGFSCGCRCRKRSKFKLAFGVGPGNGTVGCSEVDTDRGNVLRRKRHSLSGCQIFSFEEICGWPIEGNVGNAVVVLVHIARRLYIYIICVIGRYYSVSCNPRSVQKSCHEDEDRRQGDLPETRQVAKIERFPHLRSHQFMPGIVSFLIV